MSIGSGIALAGFLAAFVYACTISENVAAGVVIFGGIGAFVIWAAGPRGPR